MGSKESFISLMNKPAEILQGVHDDILGAAGPAVFEYLIKQQPFNENAVSIFKYLHNKMPEKFPYRNEVLELAKRHAPDQWLATIIEVYGANIRDNREQTSYEHILQGIIQVNWIKGVEYLLNKDPTLVNIAVIKIGSDKRQTVSPLLMWIMKEKIKVPSIVDIILKRQVNFALQDSHGNNIYHYIATNNAKAKTPIIEKIEKHAIENATPTALLSENDEGLTPDLVAEKEGEDELAATFRAIQSKATDPKDITTLRYYETEVDIPGNMFADNLKPVQRDLRLFHIMKAKIPSPPSDLYFCSLAGKAISRENTKRQELNTRLFFNFECLYEYLLAQVNHAKLPATVNAIVTGLGGSHAVNVYCTIIDKTCIKAIIIDGLLFEPVLNEAQTMGNQLNSAGISFEPLVLKEKVQFTFSGCRIISSYLASKFSYLTPNEAVTLIDDLSNKADNSQLKLQDFPLYLGLLTICASMKAVDRVKTSLPEDNFNQPINHKQEPETFNQILSRGLFHQYHDYVNFEQNPIQNQSLIRKVQNQRDHAKLFIECLEKDPDRAIEAVATLLGIKEMCEDWKSVTRSLIGGNETAHWEALQKFRFSNYSLANTGTGLRARETNSGNPEAGAGSESSGPTL